MPKVPDDRIQASLNVPGLSAPLTRQFGTLGEAEAGVGNDVATAGMDITRQVNTAEAQNFANNAYFQNKIDSEKKIADLKLQSPDGYIHMDPKDPSSPIAQNDDLSPRTITQEYHDWADNQYQTAQQSMPSDLARQMYREQAVKHFSDSVALVQNDQQIMKVNSFDKSTAQNVQKAGDLLVSNPDINNFYSNSQDVAKSINNQIGVMHNATEAQEKIKTAYQSMSHDIMQGAYTDVLDEKKHNDISRVGEIQNWLDTLDGKDQLSKDRTAQGLPVIGQMMDPVQKSVEEEKLIRLLPQAKAKDLSDYKIRLEASIVANKQGNGDPNTLNALMDETHGKILDGTLTTGQGVVNMGALVGARTVGQAQGPAFDAMSPSDQRMMLNNRIGGAQAMIDEYTNRYGVQSKDMSSFALKEVGEAFNKEIDSVNTEKKNDYAAFAQRVLPAGQAVANFDYSNPTSLATQGRGKQLQTAIKASIDLSKTSLEDNPEYFRYIQKEQGQTMAKFLNDPNVSDEQIGQSLKALSSQQGFGKYYPQVMDQMIKDNSLSERWRVAALNPTISGTTSMVSSIRGAPAIDEGFKTLMAGNPKFTEQALDQAVGKSISDWATGETQASPRNLGQTNPTNTMAMNVKETAKQLLKQDPSMSVEDAANTAKKQLIGDHVSTLQIGGGWFSGPSRQSYVNIPNMIDGKPVGDQAKQNIKANISSVLTPEGIQALKPFIPTKSNGAPSDFADQFVPQVVRDGRMSFTTSDPRHPGESGFNVWYKDGKSGQDVQLTTQGPKGKPVPVFVPTDQMTRTPAQPQNPGLLQKFMPGGSLPDSFSNGGGRAPQDDTVVKSPPLTHATDIMSYRILGAKMNPEGAQSQELRDSLKNNTDLPKWLTDDQRAKAQQFRDQTRPPGGP